MRWATATATDLDALLDRAAGVLSSAADVALACHVNPDPDALGSMLGLALYLQTCGKRTVCSWASQPVAAPGWAGALEGRELVVEPARFPAAPDVMVALDTASPDRLGSLAPAVDHASESIVIDHHRTNPGFGSVLVLDPHASSTSELVFRLIERMGGALPDAAAPWLYAGLVADTGRFQYEATTPETLRVAAELRGHPFDHVRLAQALFEESSLPALHVLATALERITWLPDAGLVWTYLTQSDLARAGAAPADTDDVMEAVRTAREADVACVAKQQRDGRFKVSLRSKGGSDVGAVAQRFGGGGHRLAAGYTSDTGLEETIRRLVATLSEVRDA